MIGDPGERRDEGGIFICSRNKKHFLPVLLLCLLCFAAAGHTAAAGKSAAASAGAAAEGEWVTNKKGLRYRYTKTGKPAKNVWLKIAGSIYSFDGNGYCRTGWFSFDGNTYYAAENGKIAVKKWVKKGGKYCYLGSDAVMVRNSMFKYKGVYYYADKSGARAERCWVSWQGKRYFFDQNGRRLEKTWLKSGGEYYYLESDGSMAVNKWIGSYHVGSDGVRQSDCVVDGYYLGADGKKTGRVFEGRYIFVGDSRMVGMEMTAGDKDTKYIAKVSMGYTWLERTGGPELKEYLDYNPNLKVVLALGVNDLENIVNYISYYRKLETEYPKTKFYLLSVNPVDEAVEAAHGYTVKNSQIKAFNRQLRAEAGAGMYINSFTYLKKKGIETVDGVHYTAVTYRLLNDYIMKKIA